MNVIITGATGFLGKAIVEELLNYNANIAILVRDIDKVPFDWIDKVKIFKCAMEEYHTFHDVNIGFKPDVFYHLAWNGTSGIIRGNYELQIANIKNSCDALELAYHMGCKRFINAGSIMEWEAKEFLSSNSIVPSQGYIYSTAKLSADYLMKTISAKYDLLYINAVISNIYGIGEYSERFINTTVKKMLKNENIPLTHGNQAYDFIYISDAAKMFCLLGIYGKGGENYYIGNAFTRPLKEFIIEMKETLHSKSDLQFGTVPYVGSPLDYSILDMKKIYREMKYKPEIGFKKGIYELSRWIK